jgi:membrane-associated phospholipid phosphatase
LPALKQLIPRLVAIVVLAVAYLGLTLAVALGWLNGPDHTVAQQLDSAWQPALRVPFQAIAELGGIEVTALLAIGLVVLLYRRGFRSEAWGIGIAFVAAQAFEIFYKAQLFHPAPPETFAHGDGPSLTEFVDSARLTAGHNSFPSGHMVRAVLVYGLIAFTLRRLAPPGLARALALPAAVVIIVLLAFDRLYLEVHWESDVIGGVLLGAVALVAATVWLDRPVRAQN